MTPFPTLLLVGLAACTPAAAQTLADIERAEAGVVSAWEKAPLGVRRAIFVQERPKLFGAYAERPTNVFRRGEPLLTYAEPIGYSWTPVPDGFRFGVTLDFLVKSRDGKVLGGQEKFLTFSQTSQAKVRELMLNVDLNLTGAPPGDYVLHYVLHDVGSGRTAAIEQPFRIVE